MIISITTIIIIAAILGISATLTFMIKRQMPVLPNWRTLLSGTVLVGFLSGFLLFLPTTEIYLLEDKGSNGYQHTIIHSYGSPIVTLSDGDEIDTKDLGLKIGKKYGFNASSSDMLFYSVVYTPASGIKLFGKDKEFEQPDPIFIQSECYAELEECPDYWFKDAPATIETESHWLISLFESMFNIGEIKWSVIPYTLEEE